MQKGKAGGKAGFLKRYGFLFFAIGLSALCMFIDAEKAWLGFGHTWRGVIEMLGFLPPIFILLGLFDVWVDRETVMRLMGSDSGLKGSVLAFLLATLAAGPLYMAFPVAGVLLKKRAGLFQIFVFIGTWAIAKLPMLLFEVSCFGFSYTLLRFVCNIAAIAGIAWLMTCTLSEDYKESLYLRVEEKPEA